jgi:hypothetical protein
MTDCISEICLQKVNFFVRGQANSDSERCGGCNYLKSLVIRLSPQAVICEFRLFAGDSVKSYIREENRFLAIRFTATMPQITPSMSAAASIGSPDLLIGKIACKISIIQPIDVKDKKTQICL